jgi:hypothetical protein
VSVALPYPPEVEVKIQIVKMAGQLPGGVLTLFPLPAEGDPQLDALMGVDDVADLIGFSRNHFRNVVHELLPCVKIGGRALYRLRDVLALIEASTVPVRKRKARW